MISSDNSYGFLHSIIENLFFESIIIMDKDKKSGLYDTMKFNMGLVNSFIDCMKGYGSARTMTEQQKRDFLDKYTIDDMELLYEYDFI